MGRAVYALALVSPYPRIAFAGHHNEQDIISLPVRCDSIVRARAAKLMHVIYRSDIAACRCQGPIKTRETMIVSFSYSRHTTIIGTLCSVPCKTTSFKGFGIYIEFLA